MGTCPGQAPIVTSPNFGPKGKTCPVRRRSRLSGVLADLFQSVIAVSNVVFLLQNQRLGSC